MRSYLRCHITRYRYVPEFLKGKSIYINQRHVPDRFVPLLHCTLYHSAAAIWIAHLFHTLNIILRLDVYKNVKITGTGTIFKKEIQVSTVPVREQIIFILEKLNGTDICVLTWLFDNNESIHNKKYVTPQASSLCDIFFKLNSVLCCASKINFNSIYLLNFIDKNIYNLTIIAMWVLNRNQNYDCKQISHLR
jgi:hypothetical protein